MTKINIILTAAINLDGKLVAPSDEPVPVEKNLAAQLIANGRAKLPQQPKADEDSASDQDKKALEGEKAVEKQGKSETTPQAPQKNQAG